MSRVTNFIFGIVLGGLVGSTVALLITPASGEKFRSQMRGYVTRIQDEVRKAAETKREELEAQLVELRKPLPALPAKETHNPK
jgi:gas vesicle protein